MTDPFIHPLADVQSSQIGASTRISQFVIVLAGAKIGRDGNICSHCLIENDVVIGDCGTVKSGVQLWDGMRVGDNVFISPNVIFTNDKHPKSGNVNFQRLSTSTHKFKCVRQHKTQGFHSERYYQAQPEGCRYLPFYHEKRF